MRNFSIEESEFIVETVLIAGGKPLITIETDEFIVTIKDLMQ